MVLMRQKTRKRTERRALIVSNSRVSGVQINNQSELLFLVRACEAVVSLNNIINMSCNNNKSENDVGYITIV